MRIGAIIQARMSSSRLQGKVLREIAGKPLLAYIIERMRRVEELNFFVVATSEEDSDDPIDEFCRTKGIACHRGPLANVAQRFADTLANYPCDAFLRYCADSPLLDVQIMCEAVRLFRTSNVDMVTNIFPRSYPAGQSIEVVRTQTFLKAVPEMNKTEREHNTAIFYNNNNKYQILNLASGEDCAGIRHCVDTDREHAFIQELVSRMNKPHWEYGWKELLELGEDLEREA